MFQHFYLRRIEKITKIYVIRTRFVLGDLDVTFSVLSLRSPFRTNTATPKKNKIKSNRSNSCAKMYTRPSLLDFQVKVRVKVTTCTRTQVF